MDVTVSPAGKRVLVMGLGRFGGGVGVARWLAAQGAHVTVTDLADESKLTDSIAQLADLPIRYRLGGHDLSDLDDLDWLVVSPAVDKAKSDFFREAVRRGIPWTSETNLFLERCPGYVIGITGSVGKSTTTAMIGAVLSAAVAARADGRRVFVGGNIGRSLLDALPEMSERDFVVLELSSFQLDDLAAVRVGPHLAVLTNLAPNHLDRHGTMESYASAKMNLVRLLRPGGRVIVNGDDAPMMTALEATLAESSARPVVSPVRFDDSAACVHVRDGMIVARLTTSPSPAPPRGDSSSSATSAPAADARAHDVVPILATAELGVPGRHNVANALLAVAVGTRCGVSTTMIADALRHFAGLPHRLEYVATVDGVRYYNDSKCTTPDAARTAITAFDGPVVVIAGGYDKGSSFDALGRLLARRARGIVCLGKTRQAIATAVASAVAAEPEAASDGRAPTVRLADRFDDAVAAARSMARPGDVVLLSPACASWDMFTNYEERGERFKHIVREWSVSSS